MIKKKKKLLFSFIVLIIAVLLFSVVWVITVYLSSSDQQQAAQQAAYQEALDALTITGWTVEITTSSWDVLSWNLEEGIIDAGTWVAQ